MASANDRAEHAATVHRMRQLYAEMDEAGTTRLETFSDGVFAIAATLLVLEIAVDTSNGGTSAASS